MAFNEADTDQGGSLSQEEFVKAFGDVLGKNMTKYELDKLYMRIDANSDGEVNWDEFMNYVLLENQNMACMREKYSEFNKVCVGDPSSQNIHSDMITGLTSINMSTRKDYEDNIYISCSKDGKFLEWSGDSFQPNGEPNELGKTWCTCITYLYWSQKLCICLANGRVMFYYRGNAGKWYYSGDYKQHYWVGVSMEVIQPNTSDDFKEHLVIGDDQGQIHLFSFTSRNWHICNLTSNCEKAHYNLIDQSRVDMIKDLKKDNILDDFTIMNKKLTEEDLIKYYHYSTGISISHKYYERLIVENDKSEEKDEEHGKLNEKIKDCYYFSNALTSLDTTKTGATTLNVMAMKYVSDVENLIVCYSSGLIFILKLDINNSTMGKSKDDVSVKKDTKFSLFESKAELHFYKSLQIHKKSINCLIYSKNYKLSITAGEERSIILWDIYTRKVNKVLSGHMSSVISLTTNDAMNQLISLSNDKNVRVWDIRNMLCIQSLFDHIIYRPENRLGHIHFDERTKSIVLTSRKLNVWPLRVQEGSTNYNDFPVTKIIFNDKFLNIISMDDGSNVLLFDLITGKMEFRFYETHDNNRITAATLDKSKRRLLTASVDGKIKMWNFSNGALLQEFVDPDATKEITDICCNGNEDFTSEIMAVGWDRMVFIYSSSKEQPERVSTRKIGGKNNREHTDDILKVFYVPSFDYIVTGSHDGTINVWHFRLGYLVVQLHKYDPSCVSVDSAKEMKAIEYIYYMNEHIEKKDSIARCLVTATTEGYIRFWGLSAFEGNESSNQQKLKLKRMLKRDQDSPKLALTGMDINEKLDMMVVSWENGNFYIYTIAGIEQVFANPKLERAYFYILYSIKGHDAPINSIQIIKADLPDARKDENKSLNLIATAGEDHLIHLWQENGQKIGTFGSETTWNLRKKDFKATPEDGNKYDINNIEAQNSKKLGEINEKLKYLYQSKGVIETEKENDDEKVSTLYNTYKLLNISKKLHYVYDKVPLMQTNVKKDSKDSKKLYKM